MMPCYSFNSYFNLPHNIQNNTYFILQNLI